MMKICSTEGCPKPGLAKGLCASCYSNERQKKARRKALEAMGDRRCENCGGPIPITKDKRARFCSDPCKHQVKWKRKAPTDRLRETCEQCGGPMDHKYRDARFCSEACGHKFRNAQKSVARYAAKGDCSYCGTKLPPYHRVYCSGKCKSLARRAIIYGLSQAELRNLLEQYDACANCGSPDWGPKGSQVDHHHTEGYIREPLCMGCNTMIGNAREDPEILRKGADYLERHAARWAAMQAELDDPDEFDDPEDGTEEVA